LKITFKLPPKAFSKFALGLFEPKNYATISFPHFVLIIFFFSANYVFAQDPTSVDPALLELENARIPKEYTVKSITVTGTTFLDTAIIFLFLIYR
jgi:hypothetical protein